MVELIKKVYPSKKGKCLGIRLIACHSSLVARIWSNIYTQFVFYHARDLLTAVKFPILTTEERIKCEHKPKTKKSVSKWELVKTQTVKQNEKKTHFDLDEVIVNRRTQFKLIAIKSGTDSNLLSVTSYAAGLLWSVCSMRLSFSRKLEFVKTMIGWACPRFFLYLAHRVLNSLYVLTTHRLHGVGLWLRVRIRECVENGFTSNQNQQISNDASHFHPIKTENKLDSINER